MTRTRLPTQYTKALVWRYIPCIEGHQHFIRMTDVARENGLIKIVGRRRLEQAPEVDQLDH